MLVHRTVPLIIVHRAFHHFISVLSDEIYRIISHVGGVVRFRLVFVIHISIRNISRARTINLEFMRVNVR